MRSLSNNFSFSFPAPPAGESAHGGPDRPSAPDECPLLLQDTGRCHSTAAGYALLHLQQGKPRPHPKPCHVLHVMHSLTQSSFDDPHPLPLFNRMLFACWSRIILNPGSLWLKFRTSRPCSRRRYSSTNSPSYVHRRRDLHTYKLTLPLDHQCLPAWITYSTMMRRRFASSWLVPSEKNCRTWPSTRCGLGRWIARLQRSK